MTVACGEQLGSGIKRSPARRGVLAWCSAAGGTGAGILRHRSGAQRRPEYRYSCAGEQLQNGTPDDST